MANYTRNIFRLARFLVIETVSLSTTATAVTLATATDSTATNSSLISQIESTSVRPVGTNFDITIAATTGDSFINTYGTATTNSFKLHEGDTLDIKVKDTLSVIGNSTSAKLQGIIWK